MHPTKHQVKYKLKEDTLFKTEVSQYQDCLALISHWNLKWDSAELNS